MRYPGKECPERGELFRLDKMSLPQLKLFEHGIEGIGE